MEGENVGGTSGNSRWNPTKEQISMLESLYKQGIRTPSADQIQQITSRLKPYGHIEGKNVFYWFQNHKARQRQKQKQENMAYVNRYLHRTQPLYPPPGSNVVCGPYLTRQGNLGLYHPQYDPEVLLPDGFKWRATADQKMEKTRKCGGSGYGVVHQQEYNNNNMMHRSNNNEGGNSHYETLSLFPLNPTGILELRTEMSPMGATSAANSTTTDEASVVVPTFFDFFSCQEKVERD